jgi:hypothetical protein
VSALRAIGQVFISSLAIASVLAWSQEQVKFTGITSASPQLIHDAMQPIALYIRESLGCRRLEQIEAEILPEDAIKRDASAPEGTADATYERWIVTSCGKAHPFVVVFWTAAEGGTMFSVKLPDADT